MKYYHHCTENPCTDTYQGAEHVELHHTPTDQPATKRVNVEHSHREWTDLHIPTSTNTD